jgi:hypothetical protein
MRQENMNTRDTGPRFRPNEPFRSKAQVRRFSPAGKTKEEIPFREGCTAVAGMQ